MPAPGGTGGGGPARRVGYGRPAGLASFRAEYPGYDDTCLTGWMLDRLAAMRHGSGQLIARIYHQGPALQHWRKVGLAPSRVR